MTLIQSWTLGTTCIDIYSSGLNTCFSDGNELWAEPQDNEHYRKTAKDLGYGDNLLLMCQEHEASHTLLSVLMGFDQSATLYGIATNDHNPDWRSEEAMVLAFQTYCRKRNVSILNDLLGRYHKGC